MKALTLTQPWATLVVAGAKRFETRSWRTEYRGPLLITSSKAFPADCRALCLQPAFAKALQSYNLPRGCALGVVELIDCKKIKADLRACGLADVLKGDELLFGDYTPGRWAWEFAHPILFDSFPIRGRLGIWEPAIGEFSESLPALFIDFGTNAAKFLGGAK